MAKDPRYYSSQYKYYGERGNVLAQRYQWCGDCALSGNLEPATTHAAAAGALRRAC